MPADVDRRRPDAPVRPRVAAGRTSGAVDQELAGLVREREGLAVDRQALTEHRQQSLARESRLAEREAVLRRRLDDKLNEKLREARTEVDRVVGTLKRKADALAQQASERASQGQPLSTGEVGHLRAEARAAVGAVGVSLGADETLEPTAAALTTAPTVGDAVFVAPFKVEGLVRAVSGKFVDVDIRGKRMRLALSDLRRRAVSGRIQPQKGPPRTACVSTRPRATANYAGPWCL